MGRLTSREKATYHPPAVIRRLAKPFWHDVTRDVNRRHRTATRKKWRKEVGKKRENRTNCFGGRRRRQRGGWMEDREGKATRVWIRTGPFVPSIRDEERSRPPLAPPPRSALPSCTSGNLVASGENVSREDNEAGEGGTTRDLPGG